MESFLSQDSITVHRKVELDLSPRSTTYLESMIKYVQRIVSTMPSPFTLFVSGGIDSQAMLYIWKQAGVKFDAINITYNGFNQHDFREMDKFASSIGVTINQKNFDVIDFLENRLDDYALPYKCSSPQICTHMAFTEMVPTGTKILSGNIPLIGQSTMNNTIYGLQRYGTMTNTSMVPFFLMSDKESSEIAVSISKTMDRKVHPYKFKCDLYRKLGIPIIPQDRKLTGFELLKDHYDQFPDRVTPMMRLRHSSLTTNRVFDQLFRNKYMIVLKNNHLTKFEEKL